jgi:hypothetical protein
MVIPTWESDIRKMAIGNQLRKMESETLISKITTAKVWLQSKDCIL